MNDGWMIRHKELQNQTGGLHHFYGAFTLTDFSPFENHKRGV
jgi:hypothetical protein